MDTTTAPVITGRNTNPHTLIDWFDDFGRNPEPNPYAFLSNFWVEPVYMPDGKVFATGEHAFAAYKATTWQAFGDIAAADGPQGAKTAGRRTRLRPDWDAVCFDVMQMVVDAKFERGSELATALVSTGDALLVEGTWWADDRWGVRLDKVGTPGRNWLGRILMGRRAELVAGLEWNKIYPAIWMEKDK